MQVVDANLLIYAVNQDSPNHLPARKWLDRALTGQESVGFAWVVVLAFIRITTRNGLLPRPLTLAEANGQVKSWLAQPASIVLQPTFRHLEILHGLLDQLGVAGNYVNDAHLAALAIEQCGEVISFDTDFGRFPGLRWRIPT
ncbi:MAG: type II toxin-antitoxin system VapC family toxin [Candidatus Dormibacteraceae bacterium]